MTDVNPEDLDSVIKIIVSDVFKVESSNPSVVLFELTGKRKRILAFTATA